MAPIKPETQAMRLECAMSVLGHITSNSVTSVPDLEALSTIKGLFSRAYKQDQWKWFTVWQQLGRPGRGRAQRIAEGLHELRRSVTHPDAEKAGHVGASRLLAERAHDHLEAYISGRNLPRQGIGYIYLLSTRENPELLKIGYTTRNVEDRVKEINSATGVLVPFGVRGLWTVKDAPRAEASVHEEVSAFRVRRDREFFRLDYQAAARVITEAVRDLRSEI